jgi:hypothetical protein
MPEVTPSWESRDSTTRIAALDFALSWTRNVNKAREQPFSIQGFIDGDRWR